MIRFFFISLILALLSGCGFTPMLAERQNETGIVTEFASIDVAPIPDRLGQMVRNGLMDRLTPYGQPDTPLYQLDISLEENTEGFGFRQDEAVTRINYRLQATYRLIDLETGNILTNGEARSNMSYDVVLSDFANFSAEQDARERTTRQLIGILTTRLALYFESERANRTN